MFKRSSLRLNLAASWASHVVALLVGVFLMPYVLNVLGESEYGSWIFINSLASYTGLLYLGFGQTLSRFIAAHSARRDWDRLNECVSVVFTAYSGMGLVALTLAGALAWLAPALNTWDPGTLTEVRVVILMLGLNAACGLVGSTFGGVLIGLQRFDVVKGVSIAGDFFRLAIVVGCLRPQWGLVTLATAFLGTTVLESVLYFWFARRCVPTLSIRPRYLTRNAFRESFGFSLKAFVGIVAGQIIAATDLIIIGQFLGRAAIVPYFIALRLCQYLQKPILHIGDISLPRAGELASGDDPNAIQRLVSRTLGLAFLLVAGMYVGAAYFGDELLSTWMGPEYAGSHRLLLILLGAQLVTVPTAVLRQILFGAGHVRTPALLLLAAAGVNLLCTLVFIRLWGLTGVALGTTLPWIVIEVCLLWPYAVRTLGLQFRRTLHEVVGPTVVPLLALWATCVVIDTWLPLAQVQQWLSRGTETPGAVLRWAYLLSVTAVGGGLYLALRIGPAGLKAWATAKVDEREPVKTPAPQLEQTCA